jgi:histidinol-phosphate aminotransferase
MTDPHCLRPAIRAMTGYTPGEQPRVDDFVKLNTNENPYPPSPRVREAIEAILRTDRLRKYPDPVGKVFRQKAGAVLGIDPEAILIGNGSDDILTILTRAFVPEKGRIVSPSPSYLLYRTLANIQEARFETVPFTQDWKLPAPWPIHEAHLTFVANPNSPSGTIVSNQDLLRLARELSGPLVIDEAYVDFADTNALTLHTEPNIIVTRTMSKSYSLAGIRFGFGIARPEIIRELNKVKDSYNCDMLSLAAATAAIEDQQYLQTTRQKILHTRERLTRALTELGFTVIPSQANFVFCRRGDRPVKPIYETLKERKILVRYMNYEGFGDGLRITVGSDEEIDRLLEQLRAIL